MKVTYTTNVGDVLKELDLAARDTRPAVVRSLNRTIKSATAVAARTVRQTGYNLRIGDIKKAINIARANLARLYASALASGRPIPLSAYSARQTAKGVSVNVLHGRKLIQHSFMATMPTGHIGVFKRIGGRRIKKIKNGKRYLSELPIKQMFGPAIPDALVNKAVVEAVMQTIQDKFLPTFEHEHEYLRAKLRAPAVSDEN